MKKILEIIAVVILFLASGLVFWAGLAPKSFSSFFAMYPEIRNTANQIGILKNQPGELAGVFSSEPILGKTGQLIINGNSWEVEIASSSEDRASGLSNRKTLYSKKGMLFVFNKMTTQSFWMKDMLIPIDMIFFDNNWKIVLIESDLRVDTFPKTFGSGLKSQYVLEVNAGEAQAYNLKVGDVAIFVNK